MASNLALDLLLLILGQVGEGRGVGQEFGDVGLGSLEACPLALVAVIQLAAGSRLGGGVAVVVVIRGGHDDG